MSQIQNFTDVTGSMTQTQINAANIDNIIEEVNRNSDQLDALNNVLSVLAYGQLTYSWDGSGSSATPTATTLTANLNTSGANFIVIVYMSRSTDSPTQYFPLPYNQIATNGNGDSVVTKTFWLVTEADTGQLFINLQFFATGSPINYTFNYLIIQQPSNLSSS